MKGTRVDGGRHEDGESEGVFAVKRCHGFDCSAPRSDSDSEVQLDLNIVPVPSPRFISGKCVDRR